MAPKTSTTGIFFTGHAAPTGSFPKRLRRSPLSRLEPRFTGLFGALLIVIGVTIFLLSNIKINEEAYSEKAMQKIQERYAQLVLNQPKPKVAVEKTAVTKVEKNSRESAAKTEEKKEEVTIDREKESFVQREQRKESSRQVREKVREQVKAQVMSSGIFAAITATSGTGGTAGGPKVSDLLGAATADLGEISSMSISKGSFAAKNVDAATLSARKAGRVSNVSIDRQEVGRTAVMQVASAGAVNITSKAPEITGESSNIEERSQAAIGRIVTRETQRLKRVYEDWLKRDPQLAGNLTVKFTILPTGAVSNVSIVKSSTGNGDFDEAILRYIKRWQFPSVDGASPVEVVYPFVFEGNPS